LKGGCSIGMDINVIAQFISQVGFPIFVAVYVMVRMEKVLSEIKESLDRNTVILEKVFQYFLDERRREDAKKGSSQ
jgi:hypothetical protein